MKKLLFFIFMLVSVRLSAQEHFSLLLDQNDISQLSSGLEITDAGEYIIPCYSVDFFSVDTFNYAKTYALWYKVAPNGTVTSMHSYRKPYFAIDMKGIVKAGSEHFLIVGNIVDLVKFKQDTSAYDIYMVKINANGDTLWTRTLSIIAGYNRIVDIVGTSDGNIAMVGHLLNKKETDSDIFLLKIDTAGNMLFSKSYSFSSGSRDGGYSLCETQDKGFFIIGDTDNNVYLIKTDSMGNKLWDKRYGLDGKDWLGTSITKTVNNEYLIAGTHRTAPSNSGEGWIKRIDSLGNIIWQKTYGGGGYDAISQIKEIESGDIAIVGGNASHNPNNKGEAWIMKLDAMGDVLWERIYGVYHTPNDSLRHSIFYNFKPTDDGGFAVVGAASRKNSPSSQPSDSWLLKLDSFGCLVEGCQLVGLENVPYSKEAIKLYPNPAKEQVQLSHSSKILSYRIAGYTGKLLLAGAYQEEGISIRELPPGVYIVQVLLEDRSQAFGRLLVE